MNKYYFFVDYENVNVDGMKGANKLTKDCTVEIFYTDATDAAKNKKYVINGIINQSKAEIKRKHVRCGTKNALDFQLCSQLGCTIIENKYAFPDDKFFYFIVSKDTGYKVLEDYFEHQNVSVRVINDLTHYKSDLISVILYWADKYNINSKFAQELYCLFNAKKGKEEIEKCIQKYITDGEKVKKMIEELRPFMK